MMSCSNGVFSLPSLNMYMEGCKNVNLHKMAVLSIIISKYIKNEEI